MSKITIETIKTIDGVASGIQREKAQERIELVQDGTGIRRTIYCAVGHSEEAIEKSGYSLDLWKVDNITAVNAEKDEPVSLITPEIEQAIAACKYPYNPASCANTVKACEADNIEYIAELEELEAYAKSEAFECVNGYVKSLVDSRIVTIKKKIAENEQEIEKHFLWILEYIKPAEDENGEYERIDFDYIGEVDKDNYSRKSIYCKRGQSAEAIEKSVYMSLGAWKVAGITPVTVRPCTFTQL